VPEPGLASLAEEIEPLAPVFKTATASWRDDERSVDGSEAAWKCDLVVLKERSKDGGVVRAVDLGVV
jgi:hypothetical protein